MTMYNATLAVATKEDLDVDDALMTALAEYHPSVATSPRGWLQATITVPAANITQAATTAIAVMTTATGVEVVSCDVMTTREFDERHGFVPVPELMGSTEVAELLGISGARVRQLVTSGKLQAHPVGKALAFPREAVEAFAERERPTGRPSKSSR